MDSGYSPKEFSDLKFRLRISSINRSSLSQKSLLFSNLQLLEKNQFTRPVKLSDLDGKPHLIYHNTDDRKISSILVNGIIPSEKKVWNLQTSMEDRYQDTDLVYTDIAPEDMIRMRKAIFFVNNITDAVQYADYMTNIPNQQGNKAIIVAQSPVHTMYDPLWHHRDFPPKYYAQNPKQLKSVFNKNGMLITRIENEIQQNMEKKRPRYKNTNPYYIKLHEHIESRMSFETIPYSHIHCVCFPNTDEITMTNTFVEDMWTGQEKEIVHYEHRNIRNPFEWQCLCKK